MKKHTRPYVPPRLRRHRRLLSWLIPCALVLLLLGLINRQLGGLYEQYARAQVRQAASEVINAGVLDVLVKGGGAYDHLVALEQTGDGSIVALTTDMMKINRLKAAVTLAIVEKCEREINEKTVGIPLGNLLGQNVLSGRGPKIAMKYVTVGGATANLASAFTSAGINQTKHQIVVEATVHIGVILPGRSYQFEVTETVGVAETILVGTVPESYTYIDDTRDGLVEKINDYR